MAKKIRIGIFGAGFMARAHLEALKSVRGAEIAGVSWARESRLKKIAGEYGVKTFRKPAMLLKQVDAVDVCLPTFLHEEATLEAAAAGRHVICEKPIALEPAAARRMISGCRRTGVRLMIAHCLRFWPEYVLLRDAIEVGTFGAPLEFHGWRHNCMPAWSSRNWLLDDSMSGGPTIDLHIHDADMILFLFGMPESVRAREISTDLVRSVSSEFECPGGIAARADAGWFFPETYPFHMGYRAVFEKAVLDYHSRNTPTLKIFRPGKEPSAPKLKRTDGYREELRYFVECLKSDCAPSMSSAEDALASLELVRAARRAAVSGRRVNINPAPGRGQCSR